MNLYYFSHFQERGEHLSRAPEKVELFDLVGKVEVDLNQEKEVKYIENPNGRQESRRNHVHDGSLPINSFDELALTKNGGNIVISVVV